MHSVTISEKSCGSQQTTPTQLLEQANTLRMLQATKTKAMRPRIERWLSHVSEQPCLPLGKFPHRRPSPTFKKMWTNRQFGTIDGRYLLEFSKEGGYYTETIAGGRPMVQLQGVRSVVSERWFESRGYASRDSGKRLMYEDLVLVKQHGNSCVSLRMRSDRVVLFPFSWRQQ